jgi:catechol 2,3-dioxygenase-like lactoylglutathione lyase family enzyme
MTEVLGLDHLYLSVSALARSEPFYDLLLVGALEFRKRPFALGGEPHLHYFNRHFSIVLRPARAGAHDPYAPGLHHLCLRVESADDVRAVALQLQAAGIPATEACSYPEYAPDYFATHCLDPDGLRLEITNYRQERKDRHDHWDELSDDRSDGPPDDGAPS